MEEGTSLVWRKSKIIMQEIQISMQEIQISMQEDTLLVCRKTGKTGEDSNAE